MTPFPLGILIMIGLAAAICVIALYHVLSCVMKHEVTLHNLRNRVESLQHDYAMHLARMSGDIPEDVIEVDEIITAETANAESTNTPSAAIEPAAEFEAQSEAETPAQAA